MQLNVYYNDFETKKIDNTKIEIYLHNVYWSMNTLVLIRLSCTSQMVFQFNQVPCIPIFHLRNQGPLLQA